MARIDLTTREWHSLIAPVLPHASTDKDEPNLMVVRIDPGDRVIYAVATDRYTLAAERWRLPPRSDLWDAPGPLHIRAADAAATLKLFTYGKDDDPLLKVTIDRAPVPISVAGNRTVINHTAITVESADGTRIVLHDQRDPSNDPLANWRTNLARMWARQSAPPRALQLSAIHLAKWGKSARKGERLTVYSGEDGLPLLILVEDHFAGMWVQVRHLDSPDKILDDSPWISELDPQALRFSRETGELTVTVDRASVPDPAPPELGPWIKAEFDGTDCSGACGNGIDIGDKIRADGRGGWLCEYCGKDDGGKDGEPE